MNEIEHLLEDVLLIRKGTLLLHTPLSDLKEFALGVQGKKELVRKWTQDHEIIYENNVGKDSLYVVIKNDPIDVNQRKPEAAGLQFSQVSIEDLCVYLTNTSKGGIDDVFNRDYFISNSYKTI